MATNLAIDDDLLLEAQEIGQKPTKKSTVTEALEEYIKRRKRLKALEMFGALEYDPNFDYKKDRKRS
jgi:Arc/MetJ family transcription regulator